MFGIPIAIYLFAYIACKKLFPLTAYLHLEQCCFPLKKFAINVLGKLSSVSVNPFEKQNHILSEIIGFCDTLTILPHFFHAALKHVHESKAAHWEICIYAELGTWGF